MATEKCPLVSVIMPMYNSAKFIPQTLESLLYQTMKDFEVVVVDDCSTDNSVEVVESFKSRFNSGGGGIKLHVIQLSKNSGISSTPRNVGIQFACGKYIAFLDSDDLFTPTALEELTTLAEEYQADVIHTNQFFTLWRGKGKSADDPAFTDMNELTNPANFSVNYYDRPRPNKPTFETNDLAERVRKFLVNCYTRESYATFYRRDFLIMNQIIFPDIFIYHDEPFTFQGMCLAKRLLLIPNINYIVRPRTGSIMRTGYDISTNVYRSLRIFIDGFNALKRIMNDIKFFNEHPDYRYAVLDWYVSSKPYHLQGLYAQVHPAALNQLVEKEFSGDDAAFAAYLFNTVNIQRLQIMRLQQELSKFQKQ